jgi:NAD(P)-dependent dehydrogenase (short-subunit alcohol dehydrogenase family)
MPAMGGRVAGKVALVTGGASGIGAATARRLAREGAKVVIVDLDAEGAEGIAGDIRAAGGEAAALHADVTVPEASEAMIRHAVDTFGRLDVLHNNATAFETALVADATVEGWARTLAVNLTAPFLAAKFAIPVMIRQGGGVIVNTASTAGLVAGAGYAAYGAAKAGVMSLTRSIATEYARHGIRANCICPGLVATPPIAAIASAAPAALEAMKRTNLLGRLGEPDEIASLVVFLASDEAAYVTGATYVIDGGGTAGTRVVVGGAGS